jgi:hypothetical protein
MVLYHEVTEDALEQTLSHGLKSAARGEKGDKNDIIRTDTYLDDHRPAHIRRQGISRNDNLYAFIGTTTTLIDITNGATVPLKDYPLHNSCLLRLSVDSNECYVSDLDRYDAVKAAVANHETATLAELASDYWTHLVPLGDFTIGDITRPEIMITRDVSPRNISLVS